MMRSFNLKLHSQDLIRNYKTYNILAVVSYGSVVHGCMHNSSDIDLIMICGKPNIKLHIVDFYKKEEIHLTVISLNNLIKDASNLSFGSLYINKFINPHTFVYKKKGADKKVYKLVCLFLDNYLLKGSVFRKSTIDQLIAITYLRYIDIFPHYASFLSNWLCSDNKNNVFKMLRKSFRSIFCYSAGFKLENGIYIPKKPVRSSEIFRKLLNEKIAVTWWYINQGYHGSPEFMVNHLLKRENKSSKKDIKKAYTLLKRLSNG